MHKENILNSPRVLELKKKRQRRTKNKIIIIASCLFLLVVGSIFLFRWPRVNIQTIEINGNKVINPGALMDVVNYDLKGDYALVFPKTNFLIYPEKKIKLDLMTEFKRLSSVQLSIKNINTLEVTVTERDGKYIWCGDMFTAQSDCYFMDSNGYIFDKAPDFSGDIYFKFFGSIQANETNPVGLVFLPGTFSKLLKFENSLFEMGLKPYALQAAANGDMTFYLSPNNPTAPSPQIIFSSTADYDTLANDLESALQAEPLQSEFAKNYDSLNYIDLRYGSKIYYKFNK